jgi:hypothetical protein
MKLSSCVVVLIFVWLFSNGCGQTLSQSATSKKKDDQSSAKKNDPTQKNYDDLEYIGERKIAKYGLEIKITARNDEYNKGFDFSFRKTQTPRCLLYRTSYFDGGLTDKSTSFISPDEEFITLPCGEEMSGYCIWKTSKIAEYFNNEGNFKEGKTGGDYCGDSMDTFKTPLEPPTDKIGIFDSKGEENSLHKFGGWKSDKTFKFSTKDQNSVDWQDYLYDINEKKIYGKNPNSSTAAKNSQGNVNITCKP